MILLVHLIFGALIGQLISNPLLAITLAFLGHYFLDFLPHIEYNINRIKGEQWKKAVPEMTKIFIDFSLGILLIFLFSQNSLIIYVCAFFAILPDGLSVLNNHFPGKVLNLHRKFHLEKIHFLKDKKISVFWRIFTQLFVVATSIILLKVT